MKQHGFKDLVTEYLSGRVWQELAGMWGVVVFFRLPGFAVAWLALRLGIPAITLTLFGLVTTGLIALVSLVLPVPLAMAAIAGLAVWFQILDCADGTVARASGNSSLAGGFADFASDILWRAVCLAAVGTVADRIAPGAAVSGLAIGLLAGFCATFARLMRSHARALTGTDEGPATRLNPGGLAFAFLSGLDQLFALIALFAYAAGWLDALMIGAAIYHGLDAGIAALGGFRKLAPGG